MKPRSSRADEPFCDVTLFPLGRSLPSDVLWSVGADSTLLFEVKSCSRVEVRLVNALAELVYRLVFANSLNESNNIAIVATGTSASVVSQLTQDCREKRQFWVTWTGDVISGGVGLNPGEAEVLRLADRRDAKLKEIAKALMSTSPVDETARFVIYQRTLLFTLCLCHGCSVSIDSNTLFLDLLITLTRYYILSDSKPILAYLYIGIRSFRQ